MIELFIAHLEEAGCRSRAFACTSLGSSELPGIAHG